MDKGLVPSVKAHEGLRLKAYLDSEHIWTIGYGTNLQVLEISEQEAEYWLVKKLEKARQFAESLPEWSRLDGPRRDVVVEMVYNLGPEGYRGFVNTRRAMQEGRFDAAAKGMLASKWAEQVGKRARRLAAQMQKGIPWQDLEVL